MQDLRFPSPDSLFAGQVQVKISQGEKVFRRFSWGAGIKPAQRMPFLDPHWFDLANKRRLFWIFQAIGWCFIPVLAAIFLRSQSQVFLPIIAFRAVFGFGITSLLARPMLRWVRRRYSLSAFAWIPVLLVTAAVLAAVDSEVLSILLSHLPADGIPSETRQLFLESGIVFRTVTYAFWISLYLGINYFIETSHARLRLVLLEAETRESELLLLRAQVNPHFLFNALNSIIAEAERPQRVIEITQMLADFLRFSLSQDGNMHPLGEEFDALESYLQVEKIRFEGRFEYTLAADAAVRRHPVPYALVQPLLENAVKYGMHTSPRPLRVDLRAWLDVGQLVLEVENSGQWMLAAPGTSTGIGLSNLRRRLELLYGSMATVEPVVKSASVVLRVSLPLRPLDDFRSARHAVA